MRTHLISFFLDQRQIFIPCNYAFHLYPLTKAFNISEEGINRVEITNSIQSVKNIAGALKEIRSILSVDGELVIELRNSEGHHYIRRSVSQVQLAVGLIFKDEIKLKSKDFEYNKVTLTYQKVSSALYNPLTIREWSFGIITNGENPDDLESLIESIINQKIPNYEIIICGPYTGKYSNQTRVFQYKGGYDDDIRAPIVKKKILIANQANFDNICLLHNRYILPKDWYVRMLQYGNNWDVLLQKNLDIKGNRVNDIVFHYGSIFSFRLRPIWLRNYTYWSDSWYIQGGAIIVKKVILERYPLPSYLNWGELEDVVWSRQLLANGIIPSIDIANELITNSSRIKSSKEYGVLSIFKGPVAMLRLILSIIRLK